jgi:protease-4
MTRARATTAALLAAALAGGLFPAPARAAEDSITLAHIRLSGSLDEHPVADDPVFGGGKENFASKLARIRKAQKAGGIHGIVLELDGLAVGWGKVDELTRAIADFRASGKKVVAYLEQGELKDYIVALSCDKVAIPESAWLMLTGVRSEVTFYKDLFDKIGLKADILQMGDFKGAPEPFLRNNMSPQLRQQLTSVLDDYFEKSIVERIAKARPDKKLTPEKVKELIDAAPYPARKAAELGLIDLVAYPDEFKKTVAKLYDAEDVRVQKDYGQSKPEELDLSNPFAVLKLLSPPKSSAKSKSPKIAVIYAVGGITEGKSAESPFGGGETVGSDTTVEAIRQAEKDESVKAIVLRVDSPGGSALASDLIWRELKISKKPVFASMGDTAASGGYYICMSAKKIFAEPGTLTGSIGVFGGKLVIGGALSQFGMHTEIISRGKNSGVLSPTTPFSPNEKEAFQALLKDCYDQFIDKALAGRQAAGVKLTREELLNLAGGRIWTGRQAKANGLIDELGTLADALAAAKKEAGLDPKADAELLILPKQKPLFERLLDSNLGARLDTLTKQVPGLSEKLKPVLPLLVSPKPTAWLLSPYGVEVK